MEEKPWFKFWPAETPKSIDYPEVPLFHILDNSASKFPNKTALVFYGKKLTFKQLEIASNKFAAALTDMGVGKGDCVAVYLPNMPQFVIAFFGALKTGAHITLCNPMYKARELEYLLTDSEASVIVALDMLYKNFEKIRGKTKVEKVITTSLKDYMPSLIGFLASFKGIKKIHHPGTIDFIELLRKYPPKSPEVKIKPKEDIAILLYTGGTTGIPKGAMLTHFNLLTNAYQAKNWMPVKENDIILSVLPFFHVYGLTVDMNTGILAGATQILYPRFEVKTVLKAIEKYKVTIFPGVPTIYIALLNSPELTKYDLTSIRRCISGAAPLPEAVMHKFNEITKGNLVEGYGLTEASPVTHCNPLDDMKKVKPGSIGIPFPDTDAKIVDLETGTKTLPPGEVGELAVKGPQVMKGYWNKPEETAKALRNGWLLTGDIAKVDEDGYFYIVDRKKDMIDASGLKVWPREVEEVLYMHPAVKEAAVIGVPHPYRGETVKAFIVLKEAYKGKVTADDIKKHCRENMAVFKVPTEIEFREELPKSMVGKVLRRVLKEEELRKRAT